MFRAGNQLARIVDRANIEILIVAAVADQGGIGDQLAVMVGQQPRLQVSQRKAGDDRRVLFVVLPVERSTARMAWKMQ